METRDGRRAEDGGGKTARVLKVVGLAGVAVAFVSELLRGRWLGAAFFLATGLLFLKGREADDWPKAVRYPLVVLYAALAVAMFVQLIQESKAFR